MATAYESPLVDRVGKILVVDDHELARMGLVSMLGGEPDLVVVGEASTGEEAISMCIRHQPDVVLMDVRMPGMDGLTATGEIHARHPGIQVLIFTMYEDQEYILKAVRAGAAGYILKDASREEVVRTIRKLLDGESVLDPTMTMRLLRRLTNQSKYSDDLAPEELTPREREVLQLVVEGFTNQEIALNLHIGAGTVKSHVEHIIAKLGAAGRTQAAVRAVQRGLVIPGVH